MEEPMTHEQDELVGAFALVLLIFLFVAISIGWL
jgi:hypothetical protein